MSKKELSFEVGQIIKNSIGQFTKILSIKDNRYGLSGWSTLPNAKKANVVTTFLNVFGLENCEVEITDEVSDVEASDEAPTSEDEKVTKKSLKALDVEELTALAEKEGVELDEADKKGDILEKLFTHFEL